MVCFECLFNQVCSDSVGHCNRVGSSYKLKKCDHWHIGQNLITRKGDLHGLEVFSRPVKIFDDAFFTLDDYFKSLSQLKIKQLVFEIFEKICFSQEKIDINNYFVSIERLLLLDEAVLKKVFNINHLLKIKGGGLTLEVTQRNVELSCFTKEAKYRLKDAGVKFALNKIEENFFDLKNIEFYDYVKFDCKSLMKQNSDNSFFNDFSSFLYEIVEMNVLTVAEKVETRDEYNYVMQLPFTHLQGFYDIKTNL